MELFNYQKEALKYTFKTDSPALFMDMRLGKSVVYVFRSRSYKGRNLIVCPISAFLGWTELLPDHVILYGSRTERLDKLRETHKYYIINWDGFRIIPEIASLNWNSIVLDESTQIKSPTSSTSKFFCRFFRNVKYKWILSGTPDLEDPMDLIQQLNFIYDFHNYYTFRQKYCYPSGSFLDFKPNTQGQYKLAKGLAGCFVKKRHEVNFLCTKIYQKKVLILPDRIRKIYDTCEEEFILEYKDYSLKTLYSAQRAIWLRLLSSGILQTAKDPNLHKLVWKTKIDALVELLNTIQEQVIVWTTFRIEFEYLQKAITDAAFINGSTPVKARADIIKNFNLGKFKRLVAQPECFKFGADFSKASCMIYFSQPNSAITRSQTEDRVVHLNKKNPVLIMDLLVKDTVDEDIHSAHNKKQAYSERLHALSKKYINR